MPQYAQRRLKAITFANGTPQTIDGASSIIVHFPFLFKVEDTVAISNLITFLEPETKKGQNNSQKEEGNVIN